MTFLEAVGATVGLVVGGGLLTWFFQFLAEKAKERQEEARRQDEYRALLELFVVESVELHRCWVQYCRQAGSQLSFSQPCDFATAQQLTDLIRTGGKEPIVRSIYWIKEANLNISNQVRWGQEVYFRNIGEIGSRIEKKVMEAAAATTFSRAMVFVRDHWDKANPAIKTLLDEAEARGVDVTDSRSAFEKQTTEYEKLKAEGRIKPRKDPEPETAPEGKGV